MIELISYNLTPVMYFGKIRRAQLAKSSLHTSTLVTQDLFRSFKVCSDAKERVVCGKERVDTVPIHP